MEKRNTDGLQKKKKKTYIFGVLILFYKNFFLHNFLLF
jgi:hypothetical protein